MDNTINKRTKILIGLAGKKQCGKSTVATYLTEAGFTELSLANPVKMAAHTILGHLGVSWAEIAKLENNKEAIIEPLGHSYRTLLQTLGTDWGRKLNPDIWINCAKHKLTKLDACDVVISDLRFENEATLVREHGGLVIHLKRVTGFNDPHVSEAGIKIHPSDVVITNNNTLDTLFKHVAAVLESHAIHKERSNT